MESDIVVAEQPIHVPKSRLVPIQRRIITRELGERTANFANNRFVD